MEAKLNLKNDIIQSIEIDDLNGNSELQDLADIIGIDNFRKMIISFSGTSFYVPSLKSFKNTIDRVLCKPEYAKFSSTKIAKELGISKRTIERRKKSRD